jgi:hypothetical protein
MQGNTALLTKTVPLTATIAQYQPVLASGAAAVAAGTILGFSQVAGVSGDNAPVVVVGSSLAVSGAAIAAGALLEVHTTVSQVVTKASGIAIAKALTAASGAGQVIEVLVLQA